MKKFYIHCCVTYTRFAINFYLHVNNKTSLRTVYGNSSKGMHALFLIMVLVLYAYYEKSDVYVDNLKFYLKHGAPHVAHTLVILNGKSNVFKDEDIVTDNVSVLHRENTGYDFGAWGAGLRELKGTLAMYAHIVFLNASCRGPFFPTYVPGDFQWWRAFTDLLNEEVRLVGPTINPLLVSGRSFLPHVQTYAFAMHVKTLDLVLNFFMQEYTSFLDVVYQQEVGLSTAILAAGYNISCFVAGLKGLEYRALRADPNPAAAQYSGDIVYPGPVTFGRQIHPYEVMFIKMNRGVEQAAISLSK